MLSHVGFFSKTWSDTFKSVLTYGKKQESQKVFHNRAKNRLPDNVNTFLRYREI